MGKFLKENAVFLVISALFIIASSVSLYFDYKELAGALSIALWIFVAAMEYRRRRGIKRRKSNGKPNMGEAISKFEEEKQ